jgi:cell filamentation protein, protein adenylyltransferase
VTFDPFGDFATEGYLRNFEKEKDLTIVKRAENASFTTGLDEAFATLTKVKVLSYDDVLETHRILFGAVYPWAGQDRTRTAPKLTIKKGPVIFANASEIRAAVEFALRKAQDKDYMKAKPGEIMGYLAYGHPFLDGNGRTIMTAYSVLAQRAGFSIDWSATTKDAYLEALTREIENPPAGHLDTYLKPFMRDPITHEQFATAIVQAPGLDGSLRDAELNQVLGKADEPDVKAQYETMLTKRKNRRGPQGAIAMRIAPSTRERRFAIRLTAIERCALVICATAYKSLARRRAKRPENLTQSPAPKPKFRQSFQADFPCPVPPSKIFRFGFTPNQWLHIVIPPHRRGAYASSRTWKRDAVDAGAAVDDWRACGRPSRVVLAPRRWR